MPRDEFETELNAQPSAYDVDDVYRTRRQPVSSLLDATAAPETISNDDTNAPGKDSRAEGEAYGALAYMADFMARDGVRHAPKPPGNALFDYSLLAVLVLVEGLVNAYFFSKNSDLGLLGGWTQAIVVAFTNIALAYVVVGGCIRTMQNGPVNPLGAAAAWVAFPFAVGAVFLLNKTAAHYRDLLEFNADALAQGATVELFPVLEATRFLTEGGIVSATALPQTLEGLLLLLLGLTFAVIAATKGAASKDAYLGYTARYKILLDARQKLEGSNAEPTTKLGKEIDELLKAMKDAYVQPAMQKLGEIGEATPQRAARGGGLFGRRRRPDT